MKSNRKFPALTIIKWMSLFSFFLDNTKYAIYVVWFVK